MHTFGNTVYIETHGLNGVQGLILRAFTEADSPTEPKACRFASLGNQFSGDPLSLPPDVGITVRLPHLPGTYLGAGDLNLRPLLVQQVL